MDVRFWITVLSTLILNDQHGVYCSDMNNPSAQVPYNASQMTAPPGTVQNTFAGFATTSAVQGYAPNAAPNAMPGFAPPESHGYPQVPQGFPQMPQSMASNNQAFAAYGGMPFAGPPMGYNVPGFPMPGIDLSNKFVMATLTAISEVAELSVSAVGLKNRDKGSYSDPICITYLRPFNAPEDAWIEFHKSETVMNDLNPHFAEKPLIPPSYGDKYTIKFVLVDSDVGKTKNDELGYAEIGLKQLLAQNMTTLEVRRLQRVPKKEIISTTSKIIVRVEHLPDNNNRVSLQMHGTNIEKVDSTMGVRTNSDPFVEIFKETPLNGFILVHRTETRENEVNPQWGQFSEPIKKFCNADEDMVLKFVCMDANKRGHKRIGEFSTSLKDLREDARHQQLRNFMNHKSSSRKDGVAGVVEFKQFEIIHRPTFTEFIRGGLKFHVHIAIDFSEANGGGPQKPGSLHFLDPSGANPNKYEQAIHAVMTILQDYDFDKTYQVFGFGARLGKETTPNNAFPVNPEAPQCARVEGVLGAYRQLLSSGKATPTRSPQFTPVLRKFLDSFKSPTMSQDDFFVVVIFTAGEIGDYSQTEALIKTASTTLPVSIIIVGVGDSRGTKFTEMEKLDGDHLQKLISNTRSARDIVQFVNLDKYVSAVVDTTASLALAKELLAELPDQVINHMSLAGFTPRQALNIQPQMYGAPYMYGNMMMPPQMMPPNASGLYAQPQFMPQGAGFGVPQGPGLGMPPFQVQQNLGAPNAQHQPMTMPPLQMQQNLGAPNAQPQQMMMPQSTGNVLSDGYTVPKPS